MPEEPITFEFIRKIQREEMSEPKLSKIPERFLPESKKLSGTEEEDSRKKARQVSRKGDKERGKTHGRHLQQERD